MAAAGKVQGVSEFLFRDVSNASHEHNSCSGHSRNQIPGQPKQQAIASQITPELMDSSPEFERCPLFNMWKAA